MKKFGRLNRDTHFFFKGTEFEITNEDDGFFTDYPFYAGSINGVHVSFEQKDVDIIYDGSYSGRVLEVPRKPSQKEEWWEYTKYP